MNKTKNSLYRCNLSSATNSTVFFGSCRLLRSSLRSSESTTGDLQISGQQTRGNVVYLCFSIFSFIFCRDLYLFGGKRLKSISLLINKIFFFLKWLFSLQMVPHSTRLVIGTSYQSIHSNGFKILLFSYIKSHFIYFTFTHPIAVELFYFLAQ